MREAVEHFLDLREHQVGHVLDPAHHLLRLEVAVERADPLGDVLGEVADALEVVGEAQRAHHLAQVDRHRLPARDGEDRLFLDLALQRVDLGVVGDNALGEREVALVERLERVDDEPLGQPAHLDHDPREILQVGVEGLHRMFRHRHVSVLVLRLRPAPAAIPRQPKRPVM